MLPLITIIVAVRNGEATIQRCIDSVSQQTYTNRELIVIDGASIDATVDIIRQNSSYISYWESKKDKGVYHAWNKALNHVKGDWICFLGADDFFWNEHCLTRIYPFLNDASPKTRVVYGKVNVVSSSGAVLYSIGGPWPDMKKKFLQINCLPHPGLMHHHSIFKEHGRFDDSFLIAGDYELLLRELLINDARFVPLSMVGMQHGGLSTLADNSIKGLKEMRRALRMHNIQYPSVHWSLGISKALMMYALSRILKKPGATG